MRRPPAPPPRPPRAPGWLWAALAAGLLAAWTIPGRPVGLNVPVVAALVGGAAVAAAGRPVGWPAAHAALAASLAACALLRSAPWVIAVDLVVAAGLGGLSLAGGSTWAAVFLDPWSPAVRLPAGASRVATELGRLRPGGTGRIRVLARGGGLGLLLLAVFGTLFVTADRAFARFTQDLIVPEIDLSLLAARGAVGLLAVAAAGAYVVVAERGSVARAAAADPLRWQNPRGLQPGEWATALGLLVALFGGFVVVQVAVLFGGSDHVLRTAGLTYAEYAREGFFQLVVVAFLTLAVIASSVRWSERPSPRWERVHGALLALLGALTLVILASALRRLGLYEDAFGFTRLRLSVHATILWLAGIFVLLFAGWILRSASRLPSAVVAFSAVSLLAFNLVDPDALIARRNVERYRATGRIDTAYLATLGPDALPALARLPEEVRRCAAGPIAERLRRTPPLDLWSFNVGRLRAESYDDVSAPRTGECW